MQKVSKKQDRSRAAREQLSMKMARLNREAVQARQLAEHIQQLADTARNAKRREKSIMDTSVKNRTSNPPRNRRSAGTAPGGNRHLSFNPLHPSSELPPEQLIRLLGLETKKQKTRRSKSAKVRGTPAAGTKDTRKKEVQTPPAVSAAVHSGTSSTTIERDAEQPVKTSKRRKGMGLLTISLVSGLLAGLAFSAWLFLGKTPAAASDHTMKPNANNKLKPASVPPAKQQATPALHQSADAVALREKKVAGITGTAVAEAETGDETESVVSEEQIASEKDRLSKLAEQRFTERLTQYNVQMELQGGAADAPPEDTVADTAASPESAIPETGNSVNDEIVTEGATAEPAFTPPLIVEGQSDSAVTEDGITGPASTQVDADPVNEPAASDNAPRDAAITDEAVSRATSADGESLTGEAVELF